MIASDVLQRKIDALPEPVLEYLYSERAGALNLEIIEQHQLNEKQEEAYFQILRELFVKDLPLERLLLELKSKLGLDDAKAKALAIDIAGKRLLPLDKWLADVTAFLRALGADPKTFPDFRVTIARRTVDEAVEEITTSVASEATGHPQQRLQNVVESVLAGVRTEAQALDVLTRPEKIGGVGLEPKAAERVLEEIREESHAVILDQRAPRHEKKEEAAPAKAKNVGLELTPEDALEVAQFKKATPAVDIDALVQEIYLASGLATQDEAMAKRVKTIIGNRLRDVRDQMETLEIMIQPKELGGLSMGQDAARALLNLIQSRLQKTDTAAQAKVQTEKKKWVETERLQKAQSETQANVEQKTELEQLYQSIVSKSKKVAPTPEKPAAVATMLDGKSAAPANLPISSASPVPPDFRAPAAPPEEPAVSAPAAPPARPPLPPPVTMVKPMPAPAQPPAPVAAPASFAQRPKLDDVKASPKLTGPVEELRAITILDFRRLSRDPKEACVKIKDKIDLLGEQSYTRRSEGIAAWTASEVTRTYLELMRESLNGTPLTEAIAAREAAKKPVLTADEFRAVADLSRQLRY
ncbi:MAG: hypothetical protein QY323_05500 [Patescibacteria group bacterium]|nr:MAG: hypothetical protein QY323_05500 [Patescibacteria group bacterium]